MKITLRIFNVLIMVLSLAAAVLLFALPTLTFKSKIAVDVKSFSKFVPETKFTSDYDMAELLGTDTINLGINFQLNVAQTNKIIGGHKEIVNDEIIIKNSSEIIDTLHEPVNLITDFAIHSVIKSTIKDEITRQVESARVKFGAASTAEEIMREVGMNDEYFTNFSYNLYDAANSKGATLNSVNEVLYTQIDDAVARSEQSGLVDNSGFTEETKGDILNNLGGVLNDLQLVNSDGSLKPISGISYMYISNHVKNQLTGKVADESLLEQRADESIVDYSDRMLELYVVTQMPDVFYTVVGYVALALLVGNIIFGCIWIALFVITLVRTISKNKPWTFFGPWFWILGSLQLVLGFGITILTKFIMPNFMPSMEGMPVTAFLMSIRTSVVIPSILFLICIPLAIVYSVFRGEAKLRSQESAR